MISVHCAVEPLQSLRMPAARDSTHTGTEIHQRGREAWCESEQGQCNKKAKRDTESTASLTVLCQAPRKEALSLENDWTGCTCIFKKCSIEV